MLEINTKEDIIIPFDKIGDDDWKINTSKIIEALAQNRRKTIIPVTYSEIKGID
ncbi:hypothetical protein [Pedobacter sp. NJ-S-72]